MGKFCSIFILILITIIPANTQVLPSAGNDRSGLLTGQLPENARLDLQVGTKFGSYASGMSTFGSYIAPDFQYQVNPALTIIAGGRLSFNQFSNTPSSLLFNNGASNGQNMPTDYSVYVAGSYKINENLVMTGTVYSDKQNVPSILMNRSEINTGINPALSGFNSHGMSMGFQYRVSETIQFGARVGVNRTDNPYHLYSPFSDPYRSSRSGSRFFPY